MSLLKRLKTLWQLSGMEVKTNTSNDVYLKEMDNPKPRKATMATIIDMNPPKPFEETQP